MKFSRFLILLTFSIFTPAVFAQLQGIYYGCEGIKFGKDGNSIFFPYFQANGGSDPGTLYDPRDFNGPDEISGQSISFGPAVGLKFIPFRFNENIFADFRVGAQRQDYIGVYIDERNNSQLLLNWSLGVGYIIKKLQSTAQLNFGHRSAFDSNETEPIVPTYDENGTETGLYDIDSRAMNNGFYSSIELNTYPFAKSNLLFVKNIFIGPEVNIRLKQLSQGNKNGLTYQLNVGCLFPL